MTKRKATVPIGKDKTYTKSVAENKDVQTAKVSMAELDAAIKNPRYRFEERVQARMKKGVIRHDAEQMIKEVIANKELINERPHIHITSEGVAHFVCGGVSFEVDTKDLNKVVGANGESTPVDRLMDSQVVDIAQQIGLNVQPFARELLRPVIIGLVQLVWYRDIEQHETQHLLDNQAKRIDTYNLHLASWKPAEMPSGGHTRASSPRTSLLTKQFRVAPGEHAVASGRESDLLTAMRTVASAMTFPQIVTAAKDKVKTRQDLEKIVARFLKELIGHKAVEEVTNG